MIDLIHFSICQTFLHWFLNIITGRQYLKFLSHSGISFFYIAVNNIITTRICPEGFRFIILLNDFFTYINTLQGLGSAH